MKALRYALPLVAFLGLAVFLLRGLWLNPREVPSPLVGKPAPAFRGPTLATAAPGTGKVERGSQDYAGQVWILNVWASWCPTCPAEKPQLASLAAAGIPVVGLNYKDVPDAARKSLARYGNPYVTNIEDPTGSIGLEYGVYGTPETFVIDRQGVIRYKHIGPISPDALAAKILPLVGELKRS
jgi:cytochrome c biogenesis protein CcmG, thiol:disulfide interchange protein DsbE